MERREESAHNLNRPIRARLDTTIYRLRHSSGQRKGGELGTHILFDVDLTVTVKLWKLKLFHIMKTTHLAEIAWLIRRTNDFPK